MEPESRPQSRLIGGLALLGLVLSLWPGAAPWRALIGHPLGETDNHLWMMWRATRRLLGDARVLNNAPEGLGIPLMDPVNLPPFAALWGLGPVLAWNGLLLWNVALAMFGGWLLGREVAGPRAAPLAMIATGAAPFLAGVADFGITESWPLGWFAVHAALLMIYARTGRWTVAVGAGLSLGAIALSGWYHALFGLILEAMLVPWLLWRSRRLGLVAQGLIGLAMALPSLKLFREAAPLWRARFHPPPPGPLPERPNWESMPHFGTDILNLLLPRWDVVVVSKATYLGTVVVGLALYGLARRPRQAGPMIALAMPFLLLAVGYWPTFGGEALGKPGLAWWLVSAVPALQGISHWHRAVGAAVPFVAVAAAVGADALARRAWVVPTLSLAVLLDGVLWSQTPWPRTVVVPDTPEALLRLPDPEGEVAGVVQIPFDNGRVEFSDEPARRYNRWQPFHGHPVAENYEGRDALLVASRLIAAADGAAGVIPTLPRPYRPPAALREAAVPTAPDEVAAERAALVGYGYRWVVLHRERARTPDRAERALEEALGPALEVGDDRVWDLTAEGSP